MGPTSLFKNRIIACVAVRYITKSSKALQRHFKGEKPMPVVKGGCVRTPK